MHHKTVILGILESEKHKIIKAGSLVQPIAQSWTNLEKVIAIYSISEQLLLVLLRVVEKAWGEKKKSKSEGKETSWMHLSEYRQYLHFWK